MSTSNKVKSTVDQPGISAATDMMNLIHWRLLVAVAEAGNISMAAERCGITQSGASQAISQMEESLGVQLFVRDRRQTTVTSIGQQVLEHARTMLAELESIRQVVEGAKGLVGGRITLASFPSVFASLLPAFLRSFAGLHPGIDVITLEGTDEEVEAWLAADEVDMGVVMNPAPHRAALILGRDEWVAVTPSHHAIARRASGTKLELAELVSEPYVLATGGCNLHSQSLVEKAGLRLTDVRITVRDWATAFTLIREGMGVSIVPESTLPRDRTGMSVFPLACPLYREFGLVCSQTGRASQPAQAFLRLMGKANGPSRATRNPSPRLAEKEHMHPA